MNQQSPLGRAKELSVRLQTIVSGFDIEALPLDEKKLLELIKRLAADARLDVRDYEYAETRAEQLRLGKIASNQLATLRQNIVHASEYNLFGAVDVAHLSAQIDQLIEDVT